MNERWLRRLCEPNARLGRKVDVLLRRCLLPACVLGMLAVAGSSQAALPMARLDRVVPCTVARGVSVDAAMEGADIEGVTKLLVSDPRVVVESAEGGKFRITVPAEVPLGPLDVRAVGTWGVSNPRILVVSQAPSVLEVEPNNLADQAQRLTVDSVAEGVLNARADVDYFVVPLEAGQAVTIDLEAERIDSAVDGVLTIFDPQGRAIELSNGYVGKDPRVDFVAASPGDYRIRVHDLVYNGGPNYFYRLEVTPGAKVDYAYPPVVTKGASTSVELFGRHLPGGSSDESVVVQGKPLEKLPLAVTAPATEPVPFAVASFLRPRQARDSAFVVPAVDGRSVRLGLTDFPVALEVEPNDTDAQANAVTLPTEWVGRLSKLNDADVIRFHASKDQVIEITGVAERMGSPADLAMLLRKITAVDPATGAISTEDVLELDDDAESVGGLSYITSSHDPVGRVTIPAEADYLLTLRDRFAESRGDGRFVYRVTLAPPVMDYQLLVTPTDPSNPSSVLVRAGGRTDAVVYALRRGGYQGEIRVSVSGLPAGVTAGPCVLGPGVTQAPLVFQATADAADAEGVVEVTGASSDGTLIRSARFAAIMQPAAGNAPRPARLIRSMALAVRPSALYALEARSGQTVFGQGAMLDIELALDRRSPDFTDKLGAITAPIPPGTVENAAVEIPAGQGAGRLSLYIKPETPAGTYVVNVKGTAAIPFTKTAADPNAKKAPVEVADPSNVIEFRVVARPADLVPTPADPAVKPGGLLALLVKVNRQNGYTGPVQVSLRLPAGIGGVSAPVITVPADVVETIVPIQLASDVPVGDKGGITIHGSAKIGTEVIPIDAKIVLKVAP